MTLGLAGEDLLQFCEINQLSVMNSFYKKKYYGTWIHSGTKVCLLCYIEDQPEEL